ncbi:hypothetical protein PLCT1_00516 [Planctomycetaceae bacterium]|nr:MAG: hypothetical protein F9K47_12210 [Burkholderiales bacterium]CAG0927889.1 hypothetical protein PLCT1_00516 [Planctomycetaceae bacterium]
MRKNNQTLRERDARRDLAELLQAVKDLKAGRWARRTLFEALPDGRMRRRVERADGTIEKEEVLSDPPWETMRQEPTRGSRRWSSRIRLARRSERWRTGNKDAPKLPARRAGCLNWRRVFLIRARASITSEGALHQGAQR